MSCWITLPTDVKMADSFSFNQGSLIASCMKWCGKAPCRKIEYRLIGDN